MTENFRPCEYAQGGKIKCECPDHLFGLSCENCNYGKVKNEFGECVDPEPEPERTEPVQTEPPRTKEAEEISTVKPTTLAPLGPDMPTKCFNPGTLEYTHDGCVCKVSFKLEGKKSNAIEISNSYFGFIIFNHLK